MCRKPIYFQSQAKGVLIKVKRKLSRLYISFGVQIEVCTLFTVHYLEYKRTMRFPITWLKIRANIPIPKLFTNFEFSWVFLTNQIVFGEKKPITNKRLVIVNLGEKINHGNSDL